MTRRTLALLLVLRAGLAAQPARPKPAPGAAAAKPKLIVAITVDQFRQDYLTRFRADYTGGLARLLNQGAVFTNANYAHAPTVTAIGHSVFLSGAPPSVSGIVGNDWYERESGKRVQSITDEGSRILGGEGTGASPRRMLVSTVGDELKMSGMQSKVIGVSLKDRSAILPAGRMANAAYWFDEKSGNFVSSNYYFAELPPWVQAVNKARPADKYVGAEWKSITKPEAMFLKLPAAPDAKFYSQIEGSPFGNDLVSEFARKAIVEEKLGKGPGTDILAISFSSNDYVGHRVGPDAPEVRDISIRTDRVLGELLDFIDKQVGLANTLVVLTADHGVAPLPETQSQRNMPGGRIDARVPRTAVELALESRFGLDKSVILDASAHHFYLNHDMILSRKLSLADVEEGIARALQTFPNVNRVYTRNQILRNQIPSDAISRRIQNGFHARRSPDVVVVFDPYWITGTGGTTHGSPHNYDTHVPVLFLSPLVKAGTYDRGISVMDIAPTLAVILGVEIPSGSAGRVLDEIVKR
ncbi:MAG: alkaline phosphatase family protein [Bryobacteraceae bacterium]|nr:alkaline phosphatase family protein [Bryobacteraceae bacterium]